MRLPRTKRLPRTSCLLLLLITATAAQAQPQASQQPPQPASLPDRHAIGMLGQDLYDQSGSTGMVLVVIRDKDVFFQGYGETAPGSHTTPTRDSLLRLCSLTKIFTTDVLTRLVLDHTVGLDDPLQRYARPGVTVPRREQPITLRELATHTSGLPRELGNAPAGTPHFTFPDDPTRWRWLPNQHLQSVPGTAAVYSNVAFDLLADALASAAHKPYAALLAARTLDPLHMHSTTFFPNAEQCARLLVAAPGDGSCTATEATAGSSGLYSTASDMTTWLRYLLGNGAPAQPAPAQAVYLLPSSLASQKGLDHAGEPTGIGLGWIHILPLDSPSDIVEKTGGGAGYQTYIAINHARQTAVFLAATEGPSENHLNRFNAANKLLLAAAGLPPLPPPPPPPARVQPHSRSQVRLHHQPHTQQRLHHAHPRAAKG